MGTVCGALIGLAVQELVGHNPWTIMAIVVIVMTIGAYGQTINYAIFVTCLVTTLIQLYALSTPNGLDTLLVYRLTENVLGAAIAVLVVLVVLPVPPERSSGQACTVTWKP